MRRSAALVAAFLLTAATSHPGEAPSPEAPAAPATAVAVPPGNGGPPHASASWFALPVVFWLPETKLGFGATGGLHFHLRGAERPSSVFVVGAYTLEHQDSADVAAELYYPGGGALVARARGVIYPDAYFGLGPTSATSAREPFTRRFAEAVVTAEYPIAGGLRAGPRVDARTEDIRDLDAGGALASGSVPGTEGFRAVGVGGSISWDTRDRPLYPTHGSFVQAWALHYPQGLGGGHDAFTRGSIEGRTFLPLGRRRVLGAAAFIEQASGDTPFTLLPKLGSTRFLRGWREGRFRDHLAWAAQAELRVPLLGRVYGAAFGAFGDVGRNLASLRADTLKVAGGVGVRYGVTKEGANVRLDLAMSEAGPEVYVLVGEAF